MDIQKRLYGLGIAFVVVFLAGIAGHYVLARIAGITPTLLECAYQTVIILSTLGSREMSPLNEAWYGQLFTVFLVFSGVGVLFALATTMTAFFVEGEVRQIFWRKKMDKLLAHLKNHIIVCGAGDTGNYVIEELLRSGRPIVLVDNSEERVQRIRQQYPQKPIPYVVGEATDDAVLEQAGIAKAMGIVVTLPDERDNLFVTVTARQSNPNVRIVARAKDAHADVRLRKAGANSVVSPSQIGGMRLAAEMVRPQVVGFLDNMLHEQDRPLRIDEIPLGPSCSMVGKALRNTNLRSEADLLVLAIRDSSGKHYLYNPPPDHVLEAGSTLIVLGPIESVHNIRNRML